MVDEKRQTDLAPVAQLMLEIIVGLRSYGYMVDSRGMTSATTPNPWQDNYGVAAARFRTSQQATRKAELPPYAEPIHADLVRLGERLARIANLFDAAVKAGEPAIEDLIRNSCTAAEKQAQSIAAAIGHLIDDSAPVYGGVHLILLYLETLSSTGSTAKKEAP
jgi:hypothetical protein